jgi:hypothetical protein
MRHWKTYVLLFAVTLALDAFGSPNHDHNNPSKVNRKDPAFVAGYDEGYRQGANDSHALTNYYDDEGTPAYQQATDGYFAQYGDKAAYQQHFRLGYVDGYKAGWDFNAGMYSPLGGGPW